MRSVSVDRSLDRVADSVVSPFCGIARVLVRFDHVARRIINANHSMM